MECRKASEADLRNVVELQNANLSSVLTEQEKEDGFLSGGFNEAQYAEMNRSGNVIVAYEGNELVGFLGVGTLEFNRSYPLPSAMIEKLASISYRGKSLDQYSLCLAGPVCVSKSHRGKGIFQEMYGEMHKISPAEIELVATLVSTSNHRSLAAHKKVGLEQVGQFDFDGRSFQLLVMPAN